jgi:hypothetical protein
MDVGKNLYGRMYIKMMVLTVGKVDVLKSVYLKRFVKSLMSNDLFLGRQYPREVM